MDPSLLDQTRREWRELGFFYDWADDANEWRVVGSHAGLSEFANLLRAYASDPRHVALSEHEHIGPYAYLKITTATSPTIDAHGIHGSLEDLRALADLVAASSATLALNQTATLQREFAVSSIGRISLELRSDNFDPASLDAALAG